MRTLSDTYVHLEAMQDSEMGRDGTTSRRLEAALDIKAAASRFLIKLFLVAGHAGIIYFASLNHNDDLQTVKINIFRISVYCRKGFS